MPRCRNCPIPCPWHSPGLNPSQQDQSPKTWSTKSSGTWPVILHFQKAFLPPFSWWLACALKHEIVLVIFYASKHNWWSSLCASYLTMYLISQSRREPLLEADRLCSLPLAFQLKVISPEKQHFLQTMGFISDQAKDRRYSLKTAASVCICSFWLWQSLLMTRHFRHLIHHEWVPKDMLSLPTSIQMELPRCIHVQNLKHTLWTLQFSPFVLTEFFNCFLWSLYY